MTGDGSSQWSDIPIRLDPARLILLLEKSGWHLVGGRQGVYSRLAPNSGDDEDLARRWSLTVPLDRSAPDFEESMRAALIEAAEYTKRDLWVTEIAPRLRSEATDAFYFRKESSFPAGLISWRDGETLISSARAALIAGAKAYLERVRRYSNRFGKFAGRYLDSVLMGQTAVGSYIVTAYAPAHTLISLSSSKSESPLLPGLEAVDSRQVSLSVSTALAATAEALEHYRQTGSYSGFENGVRQGVSYDLTIALQGITRDSDGAEITIEWDPSDLPPGTPSGFSVEFAGGDSPILENAATRLGVSGETPAPATIVGRVHLLTKKHAGGPGVFGIETVQPPLRKYRIRLADSEQYHIAVQAHDEDLALRVFGNLERDGMINWLYNAHIHGVVGPLEAEQDLFSNSPHDLSQEGSPKPMMLPLDEPPEQHERN